MIRTLKFGELNGFLRGHAGAQTFDSKTLCVETPLLPKLSQTQGKERRCKGAERSRVLGPASLTSKMRSHPRSLPNPFLWLGDQLGPDCWVLFTRHCPALPSGQQSTAWAQLRASMWDISMDHQHCETHVPTPTRLRTGSRSNSSS